MSVISVMVQCTQYCFLLKYLQTSPILYFNEISSNYWIDFKNHPDAHKSFCCQKLCQIFELQFAPNGSQLELEECCKHSFLGGSESKKSLPTERMLNPERGWGPILLYGYNRNCKDPHTLKKALGTDFLHFLHICMQLCCCVIKLSSLDG